LPVRIMRSPDLSGRPLFLYGRKITVAGDRTILPVGLRSRELFSSSPLLVKPWLGWLGHGSRITCDSVEDKKVRGCR
ncbi:hypothetical protein M5X11_39010, partial [Paenibacillus alginolyticus]|uniref:hypothetical protein n=1 Tax=Paenibacillus alginolyticus TaxID=59839 RepID=UPI002284597E